VDGHRFDAFSRALAARGSRRAAARALLGPALVVLGLGRAGNGAAQDDGGETVEPDGPPPGPYGVCGACERWDDGVGACVSGCGPCETCTKDGCLSDCLPWLCQACSPDGVCAGCPYGEVCVDGQCLATCPPCQEWDPIDRQCHLPLCESRHHRPLPEAGCACGCPNGHPCAQYYWSGNEIGYGADICCPMGEEVMLVCWSTGPGGDVAITATCVRDDERRAAMADKLCPQDGAHRRAWTGEGADFVQHGQMDCP
jgi:hypothetical protein